jgi:hypothetical protein
LSWVTVASIPQATALSTYRTNIFHNVDDKDITYPYQLEDVPHLLLTYIIILGRHNVEELNSVQTYFRVRPTCHTGGFLSMPYVRRSCDTYTFGSGVANGCDWGPYLRRYQKNKTHKRMDLNRGYQSAVSEQALNCDGLRAATSTRQEQE